jgi:D-aminoacyl-tRNA deacylase
MQKVEAKIIIFTSKMDIAAQNIKMRILENHKLSERDIGAGYAYHDRDIDALIVDIPEDSIYAENLEEKFKAKIFIFASRHSSESGIPALLTHTPGNWTDDTSMGGKPRSIAISSPSTIKRMLKWLNKLKDEKMLEGYKVGLEVTHHGPSIHSTPTIFVELGSREEDWRDESAAYIVSETIINVGREIDEKGEFKIAAGFGGPHYAPSFTKKTLETEYAIGHIIPEYVYDKITVRELEMAVKRSDEKVEYALIDWKGLNKKQRDMTIEYLEKVGLKWIKI